MTATEIYLDNNATTPLDPAAREAMEPYFSERFGNPSSLHHKGVEAERALTDARHTLAGLLGVSEREMVFTAGATESLNLALQGLARARSRQGRHLVTTLVEHDCVLATCQLLEEQGWSVTYLPTDRYGRVTPQQVLEALRDDTVLVAVMQVNNELGSINPIAEIAQAIKRQAPEVAVVSDGVQGFGKLPLDLAAVDVYAFSAHKFHGPKGAGVLMVKDGLSLKPLLAGGGQEKGLRPGTENVPAIMGMAKAAELAFAGRAEHQSHLLELRQRLLALITDGTGAVLNSPEEAVAGTINIAFPGLSAETLANSLEEQGIYLSTGSACSSNHQIKSRVLEHITSDPELRRGSLRIGLSRFNTREEIERAGAVIREAVQAARG